MSEFFGSLSPIERFYIGCAIFGGALFIVQSLLMLIGLDGSDHHTGLGDADISFKFLSMQGLTAFFMMFGLVAFTLFRQHEASHLTAVGGGAAAGLFTTWLIGRIFMGMKKLQSDGTLKLEHAVGQEGDVYLTIHAGRSGQVRLSIQNRLRHMDAVAEDGGEIPTGTRVKVVRVINNSTLSVQKI